MGIRLLGPVELRLGEGGVAQVAGAKRRAVLALLALELDRTVPVERFFELLWDEEPPAQARAALQGHVAALRKVLHGTGLTLYTQAPGYLLTGDPEQVDARRFESLTARAAALPDHAAAAGLYQEALNLWVGPALAGLPDTALCASLVERLDDARTTALEGWADRLLRLGGGASAVPALEQAVRADGLRERTIALLIRCLHQAGRHSDALTAYQHARTRLADELGVDPGPALQAVHSALLDAGAPDPQPEPRRVLEPAAAPTAFRDGTRLPRRPVGFVGRTGESRWLDDHCGADAAAGIAVVVGPAGSGKTATAIHWAHGAAAGFPDGVLFADLRGFDPAGPADPAETLGLFLRATGLPEAAVPEDPAARAALYQDRSMTRRLLVVLDNVRGAAEVEALLPAGPRCATVITSRSTLEDLVVAEGAAVLRLEALPDADALRLLERLLTPTRVAAEPDATARLVALCDRLPLALRIAAARLASRPGWTIADLVAELADERTRLLTLDTQGTASVSTALALTYRHLPVDAARLLALLAVHPGTEVDGYAAAALLGSDAVAARHALGALAAYHLLTESTTGRYSRHDLVRLFGRQLLEEQGPSAGREAAERLLDHYLEAAREAVARLRPGRQTAAGPPEHPPRAVRPLPDVRSALSWFRAEEPTLRGLVTTATDAGACERGRLLAALTEQLAEIESGDPA